MPFVPIPGCIMVEARGTLHGSLIENTLYFTTNDETTPTANDLIEATTVVHNLFLNVKANVSNEWSLREVVATSLESVEAPSYTRPVSPPLIGAVVQQSLPGNCALCISFRTLFRGRSYRGRNFIAGIPETLSQLSYIVDAFTVAVQVSYQAMIADAVAHGLVWVVASRYANKAPRVTGITTPVTAALVVDSNVDSQRRRLIGRGR